MALWFPLLLSVFVLGTELTLMFQPPIIPILDARFSYSVADIDSLFSSIGEAGRAGYFQHELVDLAFMTSYTLVILYWMRRLYRSRQKPIPAYAIALAVTPGILDVIETVGILVLLKQYPQLNSTLETVITFATPAKWSMAVILTGFLIDRVRKL